MTSQNIFLWFLKILVIKFRKYFQKYKIWWKFDKNWANIHWDMISWMKKNLHTFSVILLSIQTGAQIGENVWQYLYIQRVISQPSFAQFTSKVQHNSYFLEYFLAEVMKSGNYKKCFIVTSHFSTLLQFPLL